MLAEAWAGAEKRPGRRPTSAWARPRPCRCVARASPPRIRVVYSSDNYLVVDKPPGLAHGLTEGQGPGVMQVLRNQLAAEGECCRIYGVHRLDRDTSGLLLFAKSAEAAGTLTHAFRTRAVTKYYTGLTVRRSAKKMGTVVGDMEKGRGGSYMLTRGKENPAVTRFVTWGLPSLGLRAFVCRPETGKTHQIRVAMRSMQAPVLGDARYGTVRDARSEWEARRGADVDVAAGELWGDAPCGDGTAQLGWDRMYLHACAVRVRLPDETISLVCPPTHGALFTHPAFEAWFQGQFAGPMAGDECWFPDSPLLTSSNGGGPRHEH